MQYCVSRVRLGPDGRVASAEWGPLDGHASVLISDPTITEPSELVSVLRRGSIVWATFPTPRGLEVGGLVRLARDQNGDQTLELASTTKPRSWHEMAQLGISPIR